MWTMGQVKEEKLEDNRSTWTTACGAETFEPASGEARRSWYEQFALRTSNGPNEVAVVECTGSTRRATTANELLRLVDSAADGLAAQGVACSEVVGLAMERSVEMIVTLLAVSKLGGVSLPLPLDYPTSRLAQIRAAAGVRVVVQDASELMMREEGASLLAHSTTTRADATVGGVILSSSGSTGTPKLIARSEASFQHRLDWTWRTLPYARDEVCIQKSHPTTTHSLYELLEPLLCRLSPAPPVHILPDVGAVGVAAFWEAAGAARASRALVVPSLLTASLDAQVRLPETLAVVTLMGEAPTRELAVRTVAALPTHARLYTIYGSTEASSAIVLDLGRQLAFEARKENSKDGDQIDCKPQQACHGLLPLGTPIHPGISVSILSEHAAPETTEEASGRLWLHGPNLFRGYQGDDAETQKKLFTDRCGRRTYDTADRAALVEVDRDDPSAAFWLNGRPVAVVHRGRVDDVVKLRGYRVELGEVERHILAAAKPLVATSEKASELTTAAVAVDGVLVAFVAPADIVDPAAVRADLGQTLPQYMIPRQVYAIARLPLTARGKRDRKALADVYDAIRRAVSSGPGASSLVSSQGTRSEEGAPKIKAAIKAAITRVTGVVIRSDQERLASAGVDSMNIVLLVAQIRAAVGVDLPVARVITNPTVDSLTQAVLAERPLFQRGAAKDNQFDLNLDAVSGLRGVLALWIVRGHMDFFCRAHITRSGVGWGDMRQFWRTVIFMVLAGSSATMQYDKTKPNWRHLILSGGVPLLPVSLVGVVAEIPVGFVPCSSRPFHALWTVLALFCQQGWIAVRFDRRLVMGHAWYLTAQLAFYLIFPSVQAAVKAAPPQTPTDLSRRAAYVGFLTVVLRLPFLFWNPALVHMWPPLQMGTFVAGVLVGQASLSVPLPAPARRTWANITDTLIFFTLVLAFTSGFQWALIVRFVFAEPLFAIVVFGVSRTQCLAARFLSHPFLTDLGQYSFAIYVIHPAAIKWASFLQRHKGNGWAPIFQGSTYARAACNQSRDYDDDDDDDHDPGRLCQLPPWYYVGLFCTIVVGSILLHRFIHVPFAKAWTAFLRRNGLSHAPDHEYHAAGQTPSRDSCGSCFKRIGLQHKSATSWDGEKGVALSSRVASLDFASNQDPEGGHLSPSNEPRCRTGGGFQAKCGQASLIVCTCGLSAGAVGCIVLVLLAVANGNALPADAN